LGSAAFAKPRSSERPTPIGVNLWLQWRCPSRRLRHARRARPAMPGGDRPLQAPQALCVGRDAAQEQLRQGTRDRAAGAIAGSRLAWRRLGALAGRLPDSQQASRQAERRWVGFARSMISCDGPRLPVRDPAATGRDAAGGIARTWGQVGRARCDETLGRPCGRDAPPAAAERRPTLDLPLFRERRSRSYGAGSGSRCARRSDVCFRPAAPAPRTPGGLLPLAAPGITRRQPAAIRQHHLAAAMLPRRLPLHSDIITF
jgi:hypothetical protein